VLVNINPAYRLSELEYALNKVGCAALVTASRFKSSDYLEMLRTLAPELADCAPGALRAGTLPALRTVIAIDEQAHPGMFRFCDVSALGGDAEHAELQRIAPLLQPDDDPITRSRKSAKGH
jgi:fatty-acyl-CoA synthase